MEISSPKHFSTHPIFISHSTKDDEFVKELRQQAIQSYLSYRRAGGENHNPGAELCALVADEVLGKV